MRRLDGLVGWGGNLFFCICLINDTTDEIHGTTTDSSTTGEFVFCICLISYTTEQRCGTSKNGSEEGGICFSFFLIDEWHNRRGIRNHQGNLWKGWLFFLSVFDKVLFFNTCPVSDTKEEESWTTHTQSHSIWQSDTRNHQRFFRRGGICFICLKREHTFSPLQPRLDCTPKKLNGFNEFKSMPRLH